MMKRWRGWGGAYLFLLSFVLAIPVEGVLFYHLEQYYQKTLAPALEQLPVLTMKEGNITLPAQKEKKLTENQRWSYSSGMYQPLIVIDTIATDNNNSYKALFIPILILHDVIRLEFLSFNSNTPISMKIMNQKENEGVLTKEKIHEIIKKRLLPWLCVAYCSIAYLIWGMSMPMVFFIGLFGQLIGVFFSSYKVTYLQSTRIGAIALMPAIISVGIIYFIQWTEYASIFGLVVALCYYLYALRSAQADLSV